MRCQLEICSQRSRHHLYTLHISSLLLSLSMLIHYFLLRIICSVQMYFWVLFNPNFFNDFFYSLMTLIILSIVHVSGPRANQLFLEFFFFNLLGRFLMREVHGLEKFSSNEKDTTRSMFLFHLHLIQFRLFTCFISSI